MQYILEIVVQRKDATWECVDTIESDSAIPIPAVGDEVMTPHGWLARVDHRQFWYTYLNRLPLAKIEIRCRRVAEPVGRQRRQEAPAEDADDRKGNSRG